MNISYNNWLQDCNARIIGCQRCTRLNEYTARIAVEKRRAFIDEPYWGRPVPNFGSPDASLIIVGLAPAAHGANRTGRMFTGDESGNWLYRALHEAGLASQSQSVSVQDGMLLSKTLITAAVHCAPPANKPSSQEMASCLPYLYEALQYCSSWKAILVLGRIAFAQTLLALHTIYPDHSLRQTAFGHQVELALPQHRHIVCSYHPSQQNTFTGRLSRDMLLSAVLRAATLAQI